jgi:competence ComEA-like helix-hairpin-helix protein
MFALTPSERRGALAVLLILALGTARDLWTVWHPTETPPPFRSATRAVAPMPAAAESSAKSPDQPPVRNAVTPVVLDLNQANEQQLDALPGIGPVLAARITAHRRAFGRYGRVEDLLTVPGIGPKLFERIKSRVVIADTGRQSR